MKGSGRGSGSGSKTLTPTLKISGTGHEDDTTSRSTRDKRRRIDEGLQVPEEALHEVEWESKSADDFSKTYELFPVKLGEGKYGEVYKLKDKKKNEFVALKIFESSKGAEVHESASREVAALTLIQEKAQGNPIEAFMPVIYDYFVLEKIMLGRLAFLEANLLSNPHFDDPDDPTCEKYYAFETQKQIFIEKFTAYYENNTQVFVIVTRYEKDAESFNKFSKFDRLSPYEVMLVAEQLLRVLKFLHENSIYHLDIHEENVLIVYNEQEKRMRSVLIDFGLACSTKADSAIACEKTKRVQLARASTDKLQKFDEESLYTLLVSLDLKSLGLGMPEKFDAIFKEFLTLLKELKYTIPDLESSLTRVRRIMKKYEDQTGELGECLLLQCLLQKY